MRKYEVIAKKYRPQKFSDVCEQNAIVSTLKNALEWNRTGHAYIFCGPHGTGKTTLARLFAKALNCTNRSSGGEPCTQCQNCQEIQFGCSLDVLEIDGASNRGIDDIRSLTETVGYASTSSKYKIYLIDEVHMLTKEAFNALLKTLEDPPSHVIFFFATTEPHKVLPTVLSRCQRFDLKRIAPSTIVEKLKRICAELDLKSNEEALYLIATHAEGSLRDAESLLDQVICFQEGPITSESVTQLLGLIPSELFFTFDRAVKESDLSFAFHLTGDLFEKGFHLLHFLDGLMQHYRNIALMKFNSSQGYLPHLNKKEMESYQEASKLYSESQCLEILSILTKHLEEVQKTSFSRLQLEILLLQLIQTTKKIPLQDLVDRLVSLKEDLVKASSQIDEEKEPQEEKASKVLSSQPPFPSEIDHPLKKKMQQDRVIQFATVELNGHLTR